MMEMLMMIGLGMVLSVLVTGMYGSRSMFIQDVEMTKRMREYEAENPTEMNIGCRTIDLYEMSLEKLRTLYESPQGKPYEQKIGRVLKQREAEFTFEQRRREKALSRLEKRELDPTKLPTGLLEMLVLELEKKK